MQPVSLSVPSRGLDQPSGAGCAGIVLASLAKLSFGMFLCQAARWFFPLAKLATSLIYRGDDNAAGKGDVPFIHMPRVFECG